MMARNSPLGLKDEPGSSLRSKGVEDDAATGMDPQQLHILDSFDGEPGGAGRGSDSGWLACAPDLVPALPFALMYV